MLVSRTRPPAEAEEIAALLGAELVPMGSAGAKAMAVVAGEADLYYHAGGQHEWDNCAPAAVALARRAPRQPARRRRRSSTTGPTPSSRISSSPGPSLRRGSWLIARSADVRSDSERIAPDRSGSDSTLGLSRLR